MLSSNIIVPQKKKYLTNLGHKLLV